MKMEKKPIIEILQAAKADGDEWAQAAIEAYQNHVPKAESKSQALMDGFVWEKTPQGHIFWEKIWEKELKKEKNKKDERI